MNNFLKTNYNNVFIKAKVVEKNRQHTTHIVVVRPTQVISKYREERPHWKLQRECAFSGQALIEESGIFIGEQPVNLKSFQYRDAIKDLYCKAVIERHDKPLEPVKPLF